MLYNLMGNHWVKNPWEIAQFREAQFDICMYKKKVKGWKLIFLSIHFTLLPAPLSSTLSHLAFHWIYANNTTQLTILPTLSLLCLQPKRKPLHTYDIQFSTWRVSIDKSTLRAEVFPCPIRSIVSPEVSLEGWIWECQKSKMEVDQWCLTISLSIVINLS